MIKSTRRLLATAVTTGALLCSVPAAAHLQGASLLKPEDAAAVLSANVLGDALPEELSLEMLKFLRDRESLSPEAAQQFVEQLVTSIFATASNGQNLPLPEQFGEIDFPFDTSSPPSLQQVWDAYGLVRTIGWVGIAFGAPDLAGFVLPNNIRIVADYVRTDTNTETEGRVFVPFVTGSVSRGDSFTITTTVDVDTLIATAFDQNLVTDLLVIQAPLSGSVAVTTTCTNVLFGRCTRVDVDTRAFDNDKVLATNPTYTFAYPVNAGQFATRATAMDLFQTVYDAIGTLHTQKERDTIAASPFSQIPGLEPLAGDTGLADLATQAPAVNFYGLQTNEASVTDRLASGLLNPITDVFPIDGLDVRRATPASNGQPLDLGLFFNDELLLDETMLIDGSLGVTAGYRAEEVRTGRINIMAIRWHNIGLETLGSLVDQVTESLPLLGDLLPSLGDALPSSPATLYYDVPAGQYTLTDSRIDEAAGVFRTEWNIAGTPPPTEFPPSLLDPSNIGGLLEGVFGILGGEQPGIPGL